MRVSPGLMTFLVGLAILAIAAVLYQQSLVASGSLGNGGTETAAAPSNVKYMCPMRCVELDEPGMCPVCGMDMTPVELASSATPDAGADHYVCPMHPQVEQDRPGTCPICGMELVPKADDTSEVDPATREMVSAVKLSPLQTVLADIQAVHPVLERREVKVKSIGEVKVPEDRINSLVSWQAGRVDNLVLRETGVSVNKGDHILDIYSEELVQAQEEYLLALDAVTRLGDSGYESVSSSTKRLLDAAESKLVRLGLEDEQLKALAESGVVSEHVPVNATHSGIVMDKFVNEGMYVREGERLFTVAGLDTVWVELEIYESDMNKLRAGDDVTLFCPIHPGMLFFGRIDLIEPSLAQGTRTHRARVTVANRDFIMRPGMIMDAELTVDHGEMLMLTRNAVLHTGDGDLVYVMAGKDQWEPRRVEVGRDFGDMVEIAAGLSKDEAVAGTAVFLIDSEAQLKGIPRPVGGDAPDGGGMEGHGHGQ